MLWEYANGIDESNVITEHVDLKGIGNSITLKQDALTKEDSYRALLGLAETVAVRLRNSHQLAGMISTEIKYNTFRKVSHQITLPSPVHSTDVIYAKACALFDELWDGTPVRLLGIRTSKLSAEDEPIQLSIFDMEQIQAPGRQAAEKTFSAAKQQRLDQALDSIRKKYGADSVIRGSLLHKKR